MTKVYSLSQISNALENIDVVTCIEEGFIAYSRNEVVVPPVGEMLFEDPRGEAHIKYGFIKNNDYFVVKIASGFYENFKFGLPTNSGLMLLFSQKTGELLAILLDEGQLTAVRTAAAGAVVAKYMAPTTVHRIGIIGAGDQARRQLLMLGSVIACRDVTVWGVSQEEVDLYKQDMETLGYSVDTTLDPAVVAKTCNLIVTVTPARHPLLHNDKVRPGTHITAIGADTPEKQELDPKILARADIVVADSIEQCQSRGEIYQATKASLLEDTKPIELGNLILNQQFGRSSDDQLTIADLTGVAVQDLQISKAVYKALS
ncbi:MAG: ornithine cyclodeaminase family protein [Acidobacteria bacterium]|nr:ornithine cyclodeaminase family protein [Acidobacteriota bacterium]